MLLFGVPAQQAPLLVFVAPIFAVLFWLLRKRFQSARHARVTRPPAPSPLASRGQDG